MPPQHAGNSQSQLTQNELLSGCSALHCATSFDGMASQRHQHNGWGDPSQPCLALLYKPPQAAAARSHNQILKPISNCNRRKRSLWLCGDPHPSQSLKFQSRGMEILTVHAFWQVYKLILAVRNTFNVHITALTLLEVLHLTPQPFKDSCFAYSWKWALTGVFRANVTTSFRKNAGTSQTGPCPSKPTGCCWCSFPLSPATTLFVDSVTEDIWRWGTHIAHGWSLPRRSPHSRMAHVRTGLEATPETSIYYKQMPWMDQNQWMEKCCLVNGT